MAPARHRPSIRMTGPDRGHLVTVGSVWSTNYGLELGMAKAVPADEIDAALAEVCDRAPRFASRAHGHQWVPGTAPTVRDLGGSPDDLYTLRTAFVDEQFQPRRDAPLRVGISGRRLALVCMHGVCDTPGLVGFASDLFTTLAGTVAPEHGTSVHPLLHADAWRPAVFKELVELRRRPANHVTPFPATGAPVIASDAAVWSLSEAETERALAEVGRTGPMGVVASALLEYCLRDAHAGAFATLFVPANLRTPDRPWWPAGNHIGHLLMHFDTPADADALAADLRARLKVARYAARWEWLVGRVRNMGRPDRTPAPPQLQGPPITINVNNLGRIDAGLLPGVSDVVFLGSNSPLYPVVTLVTVGGRMSVCARVRRHHGGRPVAERLIDRVRRAFS